MNSFGQIFKITSYGESHGVGIGIIIDGCPVGIEIKKEDFLSTLSRRKAGKKGTTTRIEKDEPIILSGIFNNYSTGAPINIFFKNENKDSKVYSDFRSQPRPGHSDFSATKKYDGYNDIRGGGRFSGRLTLGFVVAGVIAKKILIQKYKNLRIESKIISLGEIMLMDNNKDNILIEQYLRKIENEGDSVGGIIECRGINIPVSLGEPFFDSVESLISHLIFSIGGIRGIEFGSGFESSKMRGSFCNDVFINETGKTLTNNCGGINGGITNGNDIIFKVAVKPTASISKKQTTFSFKENRILELFIKGRHDTAFVLRVPVIVESVLAIVLVDLYLRNKTIKL